MLQNHTRAARRGAGFTITEVLVTLGIIAVLLAVAVPSVFALQKNLKMAELDACAQQLFLASQNNLTGAKSSGTLSRFQSIGTPTENLRYVSQSDSRAVELLPVGAIDPAVAAQNYIIVWNPKTGTVREVYYAEHSFSAEEAFALSGMTDDKKAARRAAMLGYYSGDDIAGIVSVQLPPPLIEIINNDALTVNVTVPQKWARDTKLTVKVERADNPAYFKLFSLPISQFGESILVLDSLTGVHFKTLFPEAAPGTWQPAILPGVDIRITAHLECNKTDKNYLPSVSKSEVTNSLFAARRGREVDLAYSRHLQNLHPNFSGVDNYKDYITSAIQIAPIEWPQNTPFIPINNMLLSSFDGREFPIRRLNISNGGSSTSAKNGGLFDSTYAYDPLTFLDVTTTLSNIRLINTRLDASFQSGGTAGTLAGTAINTHITNCFSYIDDVPNAAQYALKSRDQTVGGLVGNANKCVFSYCGVGLPSVTGAGIVGGLAGTASDCIISNCYADIDSLQGFARVAMLVADTYNTNVSNCYAAGNISAGSRSTENGAVNGFIRGTGNVSNSYCAVSYLDTAGKELTLARVNGFGARGTYQNCVYLQPHSTISLNVDSAGIAAVSYRDLMLRSPDSAVWARLPAAESHPYRGNLQGQAYPFAALRAVVGTMPHYGSWPASSAVAIPVYFERNDAGYDYYAIKPDGTAVSTLQGNAVTIRGTGYGLLLPEAQDIASFRTLPVGTPAQALPMLYEAPLSGSFTIEGESYRIYPFTADTLSQIRAHDTDTAGTRAALLQVGQTTYHIQPRFAAAIAPPSAILGTGELPLQIRTPEQLRQIESFRGRNTQFRQTHDVNIVTQWQPISGLSGDKLDGMGNTIYGLNAPLFHTLGIDSTLQNLNIVGAVVNGDPYATADSVGIFSLVNNGMIQDCAISDSSISCARNYGIAGFIGSNTAGGKIGNCTLSNILVTANAPNATACGFVYNNQGQISNSHIRSCKTARQPAPGYDTTVISSAQGGAFGFVKTNTAGQTMIGCSVSGTVRAGNIAAGFADENAGALRQCYANCLVNGDAGAAGFAASNTGTIAASYSMLRVRSADGDAAGFVLNHNKRTKALSNCYAAATVTARRANRNAYGFTSMAYGTTPVDNCFFLTQDNLSNGAATGMTYDEMQRNLLGRLNATGTLWTTSEVPLPYSVKLMGTPNPYPSLIGQMHYGDWPEEPGPLPPPDGNVIGVFHYTYDRNTQQIAISAGALDFDREGVNPLPLMVPQFIWPPLTFRVTANQDSLSDDGYGVFWSNGYPLKKQSADKGTAYSLTPLTPEMATGDIGISSNYCFLPRSELTHAISYTNDKNNILWHYWFSLNSQGFYIGKQI